jgi:hypothetical protein
MFRLAILPGFLLILSATLFLSPSVRSEVQSNNATPVIPQVDPGARAVDLSVTPLEFCTTRQINRGARIVERPRTPWAFVQPLESPDRYLSLVVVTVPPDTCVSYHSHVGANILYVQSGTIEYAANGLSDAGGLEIRRGRNGSGAPSAGVPLGVSVILKAGEWVSQNTDAWHSFRNVGGGPAIIVVSAYFQCVVDCPTPRGIPSCRGGCRGFGH